MPKRVRTRIQRTERGRRRRPSLTVLLLLLLVWSVCLGWGLSLIAGATVKPDIVAQGTASESGTVDPVAQRYQIGKELYLENCASCHVALPTEVLPTETWRRVLLEPEQHYGQKLQPPIGPVLLSMWDYIRAYSRPELEGKQIPYRVAESQFFKALHPKVDLPQPVRVSSCVSCHPGVAQFNYRRLAPEWENSQ